MKKLQRYIAILLFVVFTCQTFTFQSSAQSSLMSVLMAATPTETLRLNRLANSFANRIAAGDDFNAVIQRDGTSKFWGQYPVPNKFFKLEETSGVSVGGSSVALLINAGTNYGKVKSNKSTPVGLESNVSQIEAGGDHILALKEGRVYAWGSNSNGQNNVPIEALTGVIDIAAGRRHSMALTQDGSIHVWGDVSKGQSSLPSFNSENVIDIVAGYDNSLALTDAGKVYAWGGDPLVRAIPASIQGRTVAISVGRKHAVALLQDKTVVAWGDTRDGKTSVPRGTTDIVAIDAGKDHTIALKSNGDLILWGNNSSNQSEQPSDLTVGVTKALLAPTHGLVLKNGRVYAWSDELSQRDAACNVPDAAKSDVRDIFIAANTSAAIKNNGELVVWGDSPIDTVPDELVQYTTSSVVKVSFDRDAYQGLALTESGRIIGWGTVPGLNQLPTTGGTDILAGAGGYGAYTMFVANNDIRYYGDPKNIGRDVAKRRPYGVMKAGNQFICMYDPTGVRPLQIFAGDVSDSGNYVSGSDRYYLEQELINLRNSRVKDITTIGSNEAIYINRGGQTQVVGSYLSRIPIPTEVASATQVSASSDARNKYIKVLAVNGGTMRIWGYDTGRYIGETEKRRYDQRFTPNYRGIDMSAQSGSVFVSGEKGQNITFREADFTNAFISVDNQALQSIKVKSLPTGSTLKLNGAIVNVNDVISKANLSNLLLETTLASTSTTFSWQAKSASGYTSNTGQVSIVLTLPNRAPVATNMSLELGENDTYTFTQAKIDAVHSDPDTGDTYDGLIIVSVPTNASLKYNDEVVQPNALIPKSNIDQLKYVPNGTYSGNDAFTYRFINKTLTSNTATCSVRINAVNDLPVLSGGIVKEVNEGDAITFNANEFTNLYSDEEGVAPVEVKFSGLPARSIGILMAGTRELSNDDIVSIGDLGSLVLRLSRDWNGSTSIQFRIKDDNAYSLPQAITITARGIQDPPVPQDRDLRGAEDTDVTLTLDVFTIVDEDNDTLKKVKISSLPASSQGKLVLSRAVPVDVNVGDEILVGDLTRLVFKSARDFNGTALVKWKAHDGFGYSTVDGTISIIIEPRPDLVNFTVSGIEEQQINIPKAQFITNFSLGMGGSLDKVKITKLPTNGLLILKMPGTGAGATRAITLNQEINISDLEKIIYTPNLDYYGTDDFKWMGHDGQHYSTDQSTVQINIADANDKPNVTPAFVASTDGRTVNFTREDFNTSYSDPEGASINAVKITELPRRGTLRLNGTDVSVGQRIPSTSLNTLVYRATSTFNGNDTFKWEGYDGEFYSKPTTMTMSFLTVTMDYTLTMSDRLMTSNGISGLIKDDSLKTWGKIVFPGYRDSRGNYITIPRDDVPMSLTGIQDSQGINDMAAYINANGKVQILTVDANRGSKWLVDLIKEDPRLTSGVQRIDGGEDYLLMLSNGVVTLVSRPDKANKKVLAIDMAAKTDVINISAGKNHALALKSDGSVVAWGDNTHGQATVPTGLTNVVAISAGANHSVALKENGTIVIFGKSGNEIDSRINNSIVNVQAGNDHTIALTKNGRVIAWGSNNSNNKATVPPSARAGIVAIETSGDHNIAIKADGSIVGWGKNTDQQAKEFPNYQGQLSNVKLTQSRGIATVGRKLIDWNGGLFDRLGIQNNLKYDIDKYETVGDNIAIVKKGYAYLYGTRIGELGGIPPIYQGRVKKVLADNKFGLLIDENNILRKWKSPRLTPTREVIVMGMTGVYDVEPYNEVYELIEEGIEVKDIFRKGNFVGVLDTTDKLHVYSSVPYQIPSPDVNAREGYRVDKRVYEGVDKVTINATNKVVLIDYKNDASPLGYVVYGQYKSDNIKYRSGYIPKLAALGTTSYDSAFISKRKSIIISGNQRYDLDFVEFRSGRAVYNLTNTTVEDGTYVTSDGNYFTVLKNRFEEVSFIGYDNRIQPSYIHSFPEIISASTSALVNRSFRLFKGTTLTMNKSLFLQSFAQLDKQFKAVSITSIPNAGTLALNGTPVRVGQQITATDLDQLTFTSTSASKTNFTFNIVATDNSNIGSVRFNLDVLEPFTAQILGNRNITIPGSGETLTEDYRVVLNNSDGVEMDEIFNLLTIKNGTPVATLENNTLTFGDGLGPTPFDLGQTFNYYTKNYSPSVRITPSREASVPTTLELSTTDGESTYTISPTNDVLIDLNVVVKDQYRQVITPEITWTLANGNSGMRVNDENKLVIPAKSKAATVTITARAGTVSSNALQITLNREASRLVNYKLKWYTDNGTAYGDGYIYPYEAVNNVLLYNKTYNKSYYMQVICYDQYETEMASSSVITPVGDLRPNGIALSRTPREYPLRSGGRVSVRSFRFYRSNIPSENYSFSIKVKVPTLPEETVTLNLRPIEAGMENQRRLVFEGFPDNTLLQDTIQTSPSRNTTKEYRVNVFNGLNRLDSSYNQFRITNISTDSRVNIQIADGNKIRVRANDNSSITGYKFKVIENRSGLSQTITLNFKAEPAKLTTLQIRNNNSSLEVSPSQNKTYNFSFNATDQYGASFTVNSGDMAWSLSNNYGNTISVSNSGQLTVKKELVNELNSRSLQQATTNIVLSHGPTSKTVTLPLTITKEAPKATRVSIVGDDRVTIFASRANKVTYIAKVYSQYGELLSLPVTWSTHPLVQVKSQAAEITLPAKERNQTINLTATVRGTSINASKAINAVREAAVLKTIKFTRTTDDRTRTYLKIPTTGTNTFQYTTSYVSNFDEPFTYTGSIRYGVEGTLPTGVNFNATNATFTVAANAVEGQITLTATAENGVKSTITLNVVEIIPFPVRVRIKGRDHNENFIWIEPTSDNSREFMAEFYDQKDRIMDYENAIAVDSNYQFNWSYGTAEGVTVTENVTDVVNKNKIRLTAGQAINNTELSLNATISYRDENGQPVTIRANSFDVIIKRRPPVATSLLITNQVKEGFIPLPGSSDNTLALTYKAVDQYGERFTRDISADVNWSFVTTNTVGLELSGANLVIKEQAKAGDVQIKAEYTNANGELVTTKATFRISKEPLRPKAIDYVSSSTVKENGKEVIYVDGTDLNLAITTSVTDQYNDKYPEARVSYRSSSNNIVLEQGTNDRSVSIKVAGKATNEDFALTIVATNQRGNTFTRQIAFRVKRRPARATSIDFIDGPSSIDTSSATQIFTYKADFKDQFGDTYQVNKVASKGKFLFNYSLDPVPTGVAIVTTSGVLTVKGGAPETTFIVKAEASADANSIINPSTPILLAQRTVTLSNPYVPSSGGGGGGKINRQRTYIRDNKMDVVPTKSSKYGKVKITEKEFNSYQKRYGKEGLNLRIMPLKDSVAYRISLPIDTILDQKKEFRTTITVDNYTIAIPQQFIKDCSKYGKDLIFDVAVSEKGDSINFKLIADRYYKYIDSRYSIYTKPNVSSHLGDYLNVTVQSSIYDPVQIGFVNFDKETGLLKIQTNSLGLHKVGLNVSTFDDLKDFEWAEGDIKTLASKGIIKGVSNSLFAPKAQLKRGDMVLLLNRAFNLGESKTAYSFKDQTEATYYNNAIQRLKELGIVNGIDGDYFAPERGVKRQAAIVLIYRMLNEMGYTLDKKDSELTINSFKDQDSVESYAREAVSTFIQAGIITGNDQQQLSPNAITTRAEVAVMLNRVMTYINN